LNEYLWEKGKVLFEFNFVSPHHGDFGSKNVTKQLFSGRKITYINMFVTNTNKQSVYEKRKKKEKKKGQTY
jgi:hypothetical protein